MLKKTLRRIVNIWRTVLFSCRGFFTVNFNGYTFRLTPELRRNFGVRHEYEMIPFKAVASLLQPGFQACDVGANIGVFTLLMADKVGAKGKVFSFEPTPGIYKLLTRNIAVNNFHDRCVALNSLVGDKDAEEVDFYVDGSQKLYVSSSMVNNERNSILHKIRMVSLDSYLDQSSQLDLIKLDVEGAEVRVLEGARKLLQKFHPLVVCEVHGHVVEQFGDSLDDLWQLMDEYGYKAINLVTLKQVSAQEFKSNSHKHKIDKQSGEDLAYSGHGYVLFTSQVASALEKLNKRKA